MIRGRQILRLVTWVFGSCLILAAAFIATSYSYGEWYASDTDTAQVAVWSAYLNHTTASEEVPGAIGTGSRPVIVIQDHTRGADRHTILALLWPVAAWSDDHMYKRLPALPFGVYARYLLGNLRGFFLRSSATKDRRNSSFIRICWIV
jgi:hypothetical protein